MAAAAKAYEDCTERAGQSCGPLGWQGSQRNTCVPGNSILTHRLLPAPAGLGTRYDVGMLEGCSILRTLHLRTLQWIIVC